MPLPEGIGSILFVVPTICDIAPETIPNANHDTKDAVHLHEDDWRQIEFIAASALPQVDVEMAELERFKRANWTGAGFKKVHIRKERPEGLCPSRLPYRLIDSFRHDPVQPLMIGTPQRSQMIVKGGFACRLSPSTVLYGRHSDGMIADLGIVRLPKEPDVLRNLLAFCNKSNLFVADWCAGNVVARPA
jgi:hypothetical protein